MGVAGRTGNVTAKLGPQFDTGAPIGQLPRLSAKRGANSNGIVSQFHSRAAVRLATQIQTALIAGSLLQSQLHGKS
jgi:hypothetical protein